MVCGVSQCVSARFAHRRNCDTVEEMLAFRRVVRIALIPALLSFAACHPKQTPINNPTSAIGLSPQGGAYPIDEVATAVRKGAIAKRWVVLSEEPGVAVARVDSGGHFAVVEIRYNAGGWSIGHRDSSPTLRYEVTDKHGPIVHRRYNSWVTGLDASIRKSLLQPAAAAPAATAPVATDPVVAAPPPATTAPAAEDPNDPSAAAARENGWGDEDAAAPPP